MPAHAFGIRRQRIPIPAAATQDHPEQAEEYLDLRRQTYVTPMPTLGNASIPRPPGRVLRNSSSDVPGRSAGSGRRGDRTSARLLSVEQGMTPAGLAGLLPRIAHKFGHREPKPSATAR